MFALCGMLAVCGAWARAAEAQVSSDGASLPAGGVVGISAFPIQSDNFQRHCDLFLSMFENVERPSIAILFRTFGENNTCLKRFWDRAAARGKSHITEIHFSNESARRALSDSSSDFFPGVGFEEYNALLERMSPDTESRIRRRIRSIVDLVSPYGSTGIFILSMGLEDNYSAAALDKLYPIFEEEWPSLIARSPALTRFVLNNDWAPPEGVMTEQHGYRRRLDPPICIGNGDGQDVAFLKNTGLVLRFTKPATFEQVKKWIARGRLNNCVLFLWSGKWQGFFEEGAPVPHPLERTFKFDSEDLAVTDYLMSYDGSDDGVKLRDLTGRDPAPAPEGPEEDEVDPPTARPTRVPRPTKAPTIAPTRRPARTPVRTPVVENEPKPTPRPRPTRRPTARPTPRPDVSATPRPTPRPEVKSPTNPQGFAPGDNVTILPEFQWAR